MRSGCVHTSKCDKVIRDFPEIADRQVKKAGDKMTGNIQAVIARMREIESKFSRKTPQSAGYQANVDFAKVLSSATAAHNQGYGSIVQQIEKAASLHGVEPALAKAVAKTESDYDANAISPAGAQGIMQLMPETAAQLGVGNPMDPVENIDGGVRYLRGLLDRYGGNVSLALAAYNAGPGNVEKFGGVPPFRETQQYVAKALEYYRQFK